MRLQSVLLVLVPGALLAVLLVAAILALPPPAVDMPAQVRAHLPASEVQHPVTAVLLNFRGYDTLLEVAVVQLALLGVLAGTGVERRHRATGIRPAVPLLRAVTSWLVPLMLLVAGYLLRAGAYRPGGAFQAAAVLAAAGVLLHLARVLRAWAVPGLRQRWALVAGLLNFALVAALPLALGARLLEYPSGHAGLLILLIETGLAISLGLLLAGLYLSLSDDGMEFRG